MEHLFLTALAATPPSIQPFATTVLAAPHYRDFSPSTLFPI